MRTRNRIAACITVLCCLLGMALAAKIKADFDKTVDFSAYKTYAWGQNVEPPRPAGKFVIAGAIDHQLQSKGLHQAELEDADLIVRYQAAGDKDLNFGVTGDPTYSQIGGVPFPDANVWTSGLGAPLSGRYIRKGTLVIDVFDRKQKKLIWSVMASDVIHDSPKKAVEQLNKIVEKMFSHYPVKA